MSYGFSPLAGFESGSETGCHRADAALERERRMAAAAREQAALEERARQNGHTPAEQRAAEHAAQQAELRAVQARAAEARARTAQKGLVAGNRDTRFAVAGWPAQSIPGARFESAEEAIDCARKVCADTASWANPSGLDGLIFTGGEETYVLAFFKAVRRLAVCGV